MGGESANSKRSVSQTLEKFSGDPTLDHATPDPQLTAKMFVPCLPLHKSLPFHFSVLMKALVICVGDFWIMVDFPYKVGW